ncbi:MAG: Pr6Pr family membrane protein [Sphingobium sp.]
MVYTRTARIAAAMVSLIACAGLAVQFDATLAAEGSVGETFWILVRFFTVLTNLMVALIFGGVALGVRSLSTPSLVGCAVLSIILVGVVYAVLLRGLVELSGGAALADMLLHRVTPVAAPLWWLVYGRRDPLSPRDPWLWALWPLAYFVYALVRGAGEGRFAYPFLNYVDHGWPSVAANAIVMAAGFVVLGYGMLWVSRRR